MKMLSAFAVLTSILLVGCSDNATNHFFDNLQSHVEQESHERSYVAYDSVDGKAKSSASYVAGSILVAPLKDDMAQATVLNQGSTNACVTLATLGAIGILTHKDSERYSPTCSMNLGNYLQYGDEFKKHRALSEVVANNKLNHYPSGWRGSTQSIALAQIKKFGLQTPFSFCGYDYFDSNNHTNAIKPDEFTGSSVFVDKEVEFVGQCSNYDSTVIDCQHTNPEASLNPQSIISAIKKNIDAKGLSLISTAMFSNLLHHGLDKSYYLFGAQREAPNIWDYNEKVQSCRNGTGKNCSIATHSMIVFGYIDHPTNEDDGLLVLRNSWGAGSGDLGNYYMSYAYAKKMIVSLYSLTKKEKK